VIDMDHELNCDIQNTKVKTTILLSLYKNNKTKVQFKLLNKLNYVFEGEIISLPRDFFLECLKRNNLSSEDYIRDELKQETYNLISTEYSNYENIVQIKLNNGQDAFIMLDFIDPETIIPLGYNAERFYIREPITPEMREIVFRRDNFTCRLNLDGCTKRAECCDHIIPVSAGGFTIIENLQASCNNCNLKKGSKIL